MAQKTIQTLVSFEKIKLLADPRRLAIIQQLMAGPASLTMLGKKLKQHPARVRHHLKILESAELVELVETKIVSGVVERFYQAKTGGYLLQEFILPAETDRPLIVFSGSHDLAVEYLSDLVKDYLDIRIITVGSLNGLTMLRQENCHFCGVHLLDENGEYNLPFVKHFFPDRQMHVVTLTQREQGLMLAAHNPKSITSIDDLARKDVHFINRNAGSGTRLWFDMHLQAAGLCDKDVTGYDETVTTHTEGADHVRLGKADAALGLRASATRAGLSFIPLFKERYDLVFSCSITKKLEPVLDAIQSKKYRNYVETLTGYDTSHTGLQLI